MQELFSKKREVFILQDEITGCGTSKSDNQSILLSNIMNKLKNEGRDDISLRITGWTSKNIFNENVTYVETISDIHLGSHFNPSCRISNIHREINSTFGVFLCVIQNFI